MRGRDTRRRLLTIPSAGAPVGLARDAGGHQSHLRSLVPQDTGQCGDLGRNPTGKDVQGMKSKHGQLCSDEADWKARLAPWSDGWLLPGPELDQVHSAEVALQGQGSPHGRTDRTRPSWSQLATCRSARPPSHRGKRGGMGGGGPAPAPSEGIPQALSRAFFPPLVPPGLQVHLCHWLLGLRTPSSRDDHPVAHSASN